MDSTAKKSLMSMALAGRAMVAMVPTMVPGRMAVPGHMAVPVQVAVPGRMAVQIPMAGRVKTVRTMAAEAIAAAIVAADPGRPDLLIRSGIVIPSLPCKRLRSETGLGRQRSAGSSFVSSNRY